MQLPEAPRCPHCGDTIDGAANLRDPKLRPKPGDFSICAHCERLLRFADAGNGRLGLREFTPEDVDDAPASLLQEIRRVTEGLRQFKRENPGAFAPETR